MQDVADVPPHLLDGAIRQHVLKSPYLPKASDLVAQAKSILDRETAQRKAGGPIDWAARFNAMLDNDPNGRRDIRWTTDEAGNPRCDLI